MGCVCKHAAQAIIPAQTGGVDTALQCGSKCIPGWSKSPSANILAKYNANNGLRFVNHGTDLFLRKIYVA